MKRVKKALLWAAVILTVLFYLSVPLFLFLYKTFPDELLGPVGQRIGRDTVAHWNEGRWQIMRSSDGYSLDYMQDEVAEHVAAYASDEDSIYVVGNRYFLVADKSDNSYRRYADAQEYEKASGNSLEGVVFKNLPKRQKEEAP